MAYRKVLQFPNQALRKKSVPVIEFGEDLASLITDLSDTLNVENGAGLSAPQIGVFKRVIYVGSGDFTGAMINPVMTSKNTEMTLNEGCLSFPGVFENVDRYISIECTYFDVDGNEHTGTFDGISAHVIQHEIEHLDGKLLIDKLNTVKRDRLRRRAKKAARTQKALFNSSDSPQRKKKNSHLSKKEIKIRKNRQRRSKR